MELFPDFEYEPKPEPHFEVEQKGEFPVVAAETMSELVGLALQLRQLEPWNDANESELMGIRDPESGDLQLVSILGGGGEVFALQCHFPPEGLTFWQDTLQGLEPDIKPGLSNLRLLECEFVNQGDAEPEDLRIFRQFAKTSRKRKLVCCFRSYEPNFLPWFFEEAEARYMIRVMQLFFRFYEEVIPKKEKFFHYPVKAELLPKIPVFTLKEDGKVEEPEDWEIRKERIPSEQDAVELPLADAEILPEMERFAVKDETWEIGSFFMPDPVSDGGRPYFAKTALCIRVSETKMPFPATPVVYGGGEKTDAEALRELLAKTIENAGYLPSKLRIASETARCALLLASEKYKFELSLESQELLPNAAADMMGQDPFANQNEDVGFDLSAIPDLGSNDLFGNLMDAMPEDLINKLNSGGMNEALELISEQMIQMERDGTLHEILGEPGNVIHADFSKSQSQAPLPEPVGEEHYRLRIEITGIKPSVWREITIPVDATFYHLHQAIQDVFDWDDDHLYGFSIGAGKKALSVGPDDQVSETAPLIEQLGRRRKKFSYTYDFGDDWVHNIQIKGIEKQKPATPELRCLDGAGPAPPEDCGGLSGYNLLRRGEHPWNDEDSDSDWKGYFEEAFDPNEIVFLDAAIAYEESRTLYFE